MSPVVFKFGGACLRSLEDYNSICDILIERLQTESKHLVVVVSAMYGHTNRLLSAARSLSTDLSGEASDLLLTNGESISAALLKIALETRGVRSQVLTAYRLGILSDSNFSQAGIQHIDGEPLRRALRSVEVAIVTGAQAVDKEGRITMLGRNSSDLTAVALAGALGSDRCEIWSDVDGVYSCDPNVFPDAVLLPKIPSWQAIEMARSGAKVIHLGAAETAHRQRVAIVCRTVASPERVGTIIINDAPALPAVVLNEKGCFVECVSMSNLTLAERYLSEWGAPFVRITKDGAFLLVVNEGVLSVSAFLKGREVPVKVLPERSLVTVIRSSGEIERVVTDLGSARSVAEEHHAAARSLLKTFGCGRKVGSTKVPPPTTPIAWELTP